MISGSLHKLMINRRITGIKKPLIICEKTRMSNKSMSGMRMIKDEIIIRRPNNTKKFGASQKLLSTPLSQPIPSHVIARRQVEELLRKWRR